MLQLRDGTWVLTAAPGIACYEEAHRSMIGITVIALLVYVAGLPIFTFCTTMYAQRHDKLKVGPACCAPLAVRELYRAL